MEGVPRALLSRMLKPSVLFAILLMNVGFVGFGLAATLWAMNEWLADERLNAIFIAFMGALFFMVLWRLARRWVGKRLKASRDAHWTRTP